MLTIFLFSIFLLICAVTDLIKRQIYVAVIIPFFAAGVTLFALEGSISIMEELGGIALGLVLFLLARVTREKIGYGDALMVMVSGAFLGLFMNIRLIMWAFLLSALVSIMLLILKKAGRQTQLPFAPFLLAAYFFMTVFQ